MAPIRLNYPPPANEQDFEELCLQLLRVHCDRPQLEFYAHRGESQEGVDIFDPSGARPTIAAQCKLHNISKGLPPTDMRAEVQKAKAFRPELQHYIILTSAKRTATAHQAVISLNKEHRAQGIFTVELMTWERINELLQQYPSVADLFYNTLGGESVRRIEDELASLQRSMSMLRKTLLTTPRTCSTSAALDMDNNTNLTLKPSRIDPLGSATDFKKRTEMLLSMIRGDERVANILNGVHIPIFLPKCEIGDYGLFIDELVLPAVKKSYETTFTNRSFVNKFSNKMYGQLSIARESRQEQLIGKMATEKVYGILFPVALQGFSISAAREQMTLLPEGFVLSGVLDSCIAMIEYPDVLARDNNVPTLVCAGTTWQGNLSLCFHPSDKALNFCVADEAFAIGSFSPGLLYIG